MGNLTADKIFPLSFKTAGIGNVNCDPVLGSGNAYSYIGFQLIEPYNLYALKKLRTHFKCSFAAGVASGLQQITKISVGGLTAASVPVSYTVSGSYIEFTVDLAPLITATGDNTIYLFFPAALSPSYPGWSGSAGQIQIAVWKVDMLYQVQGVR